MKIYSLGHGAQSIEDFIKIIDDNNIDIVIDIREKPVSRYFPHFNKNSLEKFLTKRYMFAGEYLGGSASFHNDLIDYVQNKGVFNDDESNRLYSLINEELKEKIFSKEIEFSNDDRRKLWITENFLKHYISTDKNEKAVKFLKDNIFIPQNENKNICFLCSEKNYKHCHRHIILEREWLKELNISDKIIHLGDKQKNEKPEKFNQDSLFK